MEGQSYLHWEGLQSDLSLEEKTYPPGMIHHHGPVLTLFSLYGAVQVRNMEVTIAP